MKKILFGTSALAAVALTAGSVNADAPTVAFDGAVSYAAVSYSNKIKKKSENGRRLTKDVKADNLKSELHWTAMGTADNGLEYTGRVDWRYLENTIDEAWVKLGGGWGAVVLGMDDGVEDTVPDANSVSGGSWGIDGNYVGKYIDSNGSSAPLVTATGSSGDANKIAYYSPSFNGLSFSASLAPADTRADSASKGSVEKFKNTTELGLSYSGDMGGVSVNLGGAYVMAKRLSTGNMIDNPDYNAPPRLIAAAANGVPSAAEIAAYDLALAAYDALSDEERAALAKIPGGPDTEYNKVKSYHVGGTVGMADFNVGAGYVDNGKSGVEKGSVANAGKAWNVGVNYKGIDKITLSTVYTSSKIKTTDKDDSKKSAGNDTKKVWTASVDYAVADGLTTFVEFANIRNKDASKKENNKNSGNVFLLGTTIAF